MTPQEIYGMEWMKSCQVTKSFNYVMKYTSSGVRSSLMKVVVCNKGGRSDTN